MLRCITHARVQCIIAPNDCPFMTSRLLIPHFLILTPRSLPVTPYSPHLFSSSKHNTVFEVPPDPSLSPRAFDLTTAGLTQFGWDDNRYSHSPSWLSLLVVDSIISLFLTSWAAPFTFLRDDGGGLHDLIEGDALIIAPAVLPYSKNCTVPYPVLYNTKHSMKYSVLYCA